MKYENLLSETAAGVADCVRQAGYLTLEQGLDLEAKCYAICCTNPNAIPGLEAFLKKRRAK